MNGPLILADRAQTIERQVEALADPHAGVTEKQQCVADPIVTPQHFLWDQMVLLGCQRPWQTLVGARDIFGTDETGEKRYPLGPCQFFKNTAQTDDIVSVSYLGQRGLVRAQKSEPVQDVRIAAELL